MDDRYYCHAHGGSWLVCDVASDSVIAVRPDFDSARSTVERLNNRPYPPVPADVDPMTAAAVAAALRALADGLDEALDGGGIDTLAAAESTARELRALAGRLAGTE